MKKIIWISIVVVSLAAFLAFRTEGKASVSSDTTVSAADKVEVYYFHLTRRCYTCLAVEEETKKDIIALYPEEYKTGMVTFSAFDIEDEASKPAAAKAQANGQLLVVLSGDFRKELTKEGFMYAKKDPEKFKAEIQKTIDPLLKAIK